MNSRRITITISVCTIFVFIFICLYSGNFQLTGITNLLTLRWKNIIVIFHNLYFHFLMRRYLYEVSAIVSETLQNLNLQNSHNNFIFIKLEINNELFFSLSKIKQKPTHYQNESYQKILSKCPTNRKHVLHWLRNEDK